MRANYSIGSEPDFRHRVLGIGGVEFLASRMPLWSPDGRYALYVSNESGTDEVWLWPSGGQPQFKLTSLGGRIQSMSWSPDANSVAVACNRSGAYDIYRVDVLSGKTTRLTNDARYEVNPVFTPDSSHILYVRLDDKWEDHDIIAMGIDGSNPSVVTSDTDFFDYSYGRTFGQPLVSSNGDTALFRSQRSGYTNIWRVPLDNGEPEPLVAEEADQSDAAWSPDGKEVAYISNHNGTFGLKVASAENSTVQTLFSPSVGVCSAPQWSPDGERISFVYGTPTAPEDLWLISSSGGEPKQLTFSLPEGNLQGRLISPEKISFKSFDGLTISAYLYSPADKLNGARYPGIMFIHGGPTNQFYDSYEPHVQYLVQRGYVVMLPNIRGSAGYGKEFEELNDGDWGHGDLKDVIAGADYLKTLPYVDSDNLGITGTSYGGIMSMCATTFAPGVFQAAVPMSGYADWPELRYEVELRHIKLMEHEFGPYEENKDTWVRSSAIYRVADAGTPCLVLHGEGKEPGSNASRAFVAAMKQHYKPVEYKVYPNECYYVRSTENVRQMLIDVADFFDRYLEYGAS